MKKEYQVEELSNSKDTGDVLHIILNCLTYTKRRICIISVLFVALSSSSCSLVSTGWDIKGSGISFTFSIKSYTYVQILIPGITIYIIIRYKCRK